ncbi:unnamed protein product [Caenorhabditis angaria]|uniref:WD40 repeat-like protein n=1 Tax=Caenorhabditis angaria TaxID=860376 RepID=A0A9P1NAH7_9PELO|nr:unnamed protein product [Caenorhabditis angaria]
MPSICVDQLNILIWRYLQENGYNHAAYTFGLESSITEVEKDCAHSALIPIGALVRLVYKGIMYTEAEDNDKKSYSLLEAVFRLDANQQAAAADSSDDEPEKMDESEQESGEDEEEEEEEEDDETEEDDSDDDIEIIKRPSIPSTESILARSKTTRGLVRIKPSSQSTTAAASTSTPSTSATTRKPAPMTLAEKKLMQRKEVAKPQKVPERKTPINIEGSMIKYLCGHNAEAFICSWNPRDSIVASGSGDSTGRLWYLHNIDTSSAKSLEKQSKVLKHTFSGIMSTPNKQVNHDVTSLDWSNDGSKLATGCYDGYARIWSKEGHLQSCLEFHKGPIFAVKWNVTGEYLVTAGVDKSTVVWNSDGTMKQSYTVHESSALDVDWVSRDSFASCSTDKKIMICKVNHFTPIKTLVGHQNEVNAIRYDSHSKRIASCSDDKTLKIWSVEEAAALYTFSDHEKEIYTLRWNPNGHIVASASFDHTVRLFDVNQGKCIKVLEGHTDPVYSVTFSPDGRYIASGCFDRSVFVWDVNTGTCVGKYVGDKNDGGIFEVSWSHTGNRLAASASDGKIILMDVRKII